MDVEYVLFEIHEMTNKDMSLTYYATDVTKRGSKLTLIVLLNVSAVPWCWVTCVVLGDVCGVG